MKKINGIFFAVMMVFSIISTEIKSQNNDPHQIEGVLVELRVYLAGYMSTNIVDTLMRSDHLTSGLLPSTPLDVAGGMGHVFPNQNKWLSSANTRYNVPDSILKKYNIVSYGQIELRKGSMSKPSRQYSEYCMISRNGDVRNLAGGRKVRFKTVSQGDYYVIIHQGNHLSIGSKNKFDVSEPIVHDFTTGLDKYYSEWLGGRRYINDPAIEVRPGIWAMYGGDCSGAGIGENGPDNFVDFSDLSFLLNHYGSNIYNLGDLEANTKISSSDSILFYNWAFFGSYIPYIWTTMPNQYRIMIDTNQLPTYRLTADDFIKNGDTIIFSVDISKPDQDTLLFRWAQLMLKLNYNSAINIDTILLQCPIANSQIFLSQSVLQIGMMSNNPIKVFNTAPYQLAKVRVVFREGTCPSPQGLLNWTTTGIRTKIFSQINDSLKEITNHESHFIDDSIVLGINSISGDRLDYMLSQNYPNPFNPFTVVNFSIPKKVSTSLKIYNINGKEISTLIEGIKEAGYYTVNIDGNHLSSGIYFYRITAGDFIETKKMILIK